MTTKELIEPTEPLLEPLSFAKRSCVGDDL